MTPQKLEEIEAELMDKFCVMFERAGKEYVEKLEFFIKSKLTEAEAVGYERGMKEHNDCATKLTALADEMFEKGKASGRKEMRDELETYECGHYEAGAEAMKKTAIELVNKHDPSVRRTTSEHYWGNTLRNALEALPINETLR